jgi:hypothetical protein
MSFYDRLAMMTDATHCDEELKAEIDDQNQDGGKGQG